MKEKLDKVNWEAEFQKCTDGVEGMWSCFKNNLHIIENECIPRKKLFINGKSSKKFSIKLD